MSTFRPVVTLSCLLVLGAGLLVGCGSDDGDGNDGSGGGDESPARAEGIQLGDLLERLSADAVDPDHLFLEFSADQQLRPLVDPEAEFAEDPWGQSVNSGAPALFSVGPKELEEFGIALDATAATISVGAPPATLGLLLGGQDAGAITTAAEDAGWTDEDGVLTTGINVEEPLSLQMPQLRPDGENLVYGGADADLSHVDGDGSTLADHPVLSSLAACLGDALTVTVATAAEDTPVGVGATFNPDNPSQPRTLVCVAARSDEDAEQLAEAMLQAVESGDSIQSMQPYSEYFAEPETGVLDEEVPVAKLEVLNADDRPAITIQTMLAAQDLPGLQAEGKVPAGSPSAGPTD